MKRQAIELLSHDLKCDAPGCDFIEPHELSARFIGKPCPKCGSNLLTQEDYDAAKEIEVALTIINAIYEVPDDAPSSPVQAVSLNPHAGDLYITVHGDDTGGAR